jgi:hypothetical protein
MKTTFYLSITFSILSLFSYAQKTNETTTFEPIKESEKPASLMKNNSTIHTSEIATGESEKKSKVVTYRQVFGDETKKVQVQIKEANGKKKMRLTEYTNGNERVTMYEGDAVDKKLKELESRFPNSKQ